MSNEATSYNGLKKVATFAGKFTLNNGISKMICYVFIMPKISDKAAFTKKFKIKLP